MTQDLDKAYRENPSFWTKKKDRFTVVGDYLGRWPAINLVDPQSCEFILDAGCGAGFVTRRLARKRPLAKLFGCDRNESMLSAAIEREKQTKLSINYRLGDMTQMPYANHSFDKVACIAALFHNSPEEVNRILSESNRVLRLGGKLIISIMHPELYHPESPNNQTEDSWVKYTQLDDKPFTEPKFFRENYRNNKGEIFTSELWYYPESFLVKSVQNAGFEVIKTQSQYVTEKVLKDCNQTGPAGYPAFYQILAKKGEELR